jgi:hypothetical protein
MKIVEECEWSRSAEEEVMQDALGYDALNTKLSKLSASLVIWENEITRSGRDPDTAEWSTLCLSFKHARVSFEHARGFCFR